MGVPRGARPPSHTAYFVALAGVLLLLIMLLCYCLCFCLKRIKELARQPLPEPVKSVRPPPPSTAAYPVQPEVRESATAMARLCKQIPQTHTDTVFPRLSPSKPSMLASPRSPPAPRPPGYAAAPGAYALSSTGRVLARSPGSRAAPLPPPKVISQAMARARPSSMPDQPTPAISVTGGE